MVHGTVGVMRKMETRCKRIKTLMYFEAPNWNAVLVKERSHFQLMCLLHCYALSCNIQPNGFINSAYLSSE